MSIHVITIDVETISAATGQIYTTVPLYGILGDEIVNVVFFQESINRLIAKHELLLNEEITEIQLVCNGLGLSVVRHSKIKNLDADDRITCSNSFIMKTCKVYEFYPAQSLKTVLNAFTNIGINVVKVWSVFGLFLLNAKQMIARERITFMLLGARKITVCNFDGAGSVSGVYEFGKGISDVIEYVTAAVKAKFGHVKRETVILVLQNFIHFNEIEFIQKMHNTRYIKSGVMSSANYDVVYYVSSVLREYMRQVMDSIGIVGETKCFLYAQHEYVQSFIKILSMVTSHEVRYVAKDLTATHVQEKKQSVVVKDILRFLLNKK